MSTGAKVAIGCAIALVLGGIVTVVAVGGAVWWGAGKVKEKVGDLGANEERIESYRRKANAVRFERPPDGVLQEERLVQFLEVRKRAYRVYEKHRAMLEEMGREHDRPNLGAITGAISAVGEMRLAVAQAQAEVGMSEDEYAYMVEQVYRTLWASEVAHSTGGKSAAEAVEDAYEKTARELEKAQHDTEDAREVAPEGAEMVRRAAREAAEKMREQAEAVRKGAQELEVPPANLALFRKYEADIKKYAMTGLELIGM